MLDGTSGCVGSDDVVAHVGAGREADRQLRRIARSRATLDVDEARWLLVGRREAIHVELGFVTFVEYCERVLGYSPRVAHERLRIAEALEELPGMRAAMVAGEVSYSVVRELTRVAVVGTEDEWIAAARGRTARDVEAMVSGHRVGDRPEDPVDQDLRLRSLRFDVLPDTYALFLEAERRARQEAGHVVSDDEVIAWLCRSALRPAQADDEAQAPPYQIALTVCEQCDRATADGAGQVVDVSGVVVAMARCDASELGRVDGEAITPVRRTLTDARRLRVFRRDHRRWSVPGCRSTRFLHIHHVRAQEHGGGHEAGNLLLLCGGHHRAVHDGRLRITGRAPGALRFEHGDASPWSTAVDLVADARSALRNLGFGAVETERAIDAARTRGGTGVLEDLVRRALVELRPARPARLSKHIQVRGHADAIERRAHHERDLDP